MSQEIGDIGQVIDCEYGPLSSDEVESFRRATETTHTKGIPLTFASRFRRGEFEWLDRMKVNMRNLLHTEQEYEYHTPLKVGDQLVISTKLAEVRERRGIKFVNLETHVKARDELRIVARTGFILRQAKEGA